MRKNRFASQAISIEAALSCILVRPQSINPIKEEVHEIMTSQNKKSELRLSEVRSRLNEISGLEGDALTDEIRNEAETLQGEYAGLEIRHRAAITSEATDEARMMGAFGMKATGRARKSASLWARFQSATISGGRRPASASKAGRRN